MIYHVYKMNTVVEVTIGPFIPRPLANGVLES